MVFSCLKILNIVLNTEIPLEKNSSGLCALTHSRAGCLVPTKRAATTGSRARHPVPKVIRATSHITRATARRGKMYETLHKRTSADRGDLTCPPHHPNPPSCLQLTDCHVPLLLPDSSLERLLVVFKHLQYVSLSRFLGWQATISSSKKKNKKRIIIGNGAWFLGPGQKPQRIKWSFASQQLLWRSSFPSHSQHLHNMPLAPPAVQEKTGWVSGNLLWSNTWSCRQENRIKNFIQKRKKKRRKEQMA